MLWDIPFSVFVGVVLALIWVSALWLSALWMDVAAIAPVAAKRIAAANPVIVFIFMPLLLRAVFDRRQRNCVSATVQGALARQHQLEMSAV
jgi:hypothetical protein